MNAKYMIPYRAAFVCLLATSVADLTGCGNFFQYPYNQATFSTQTQVFMDANHTQSPIITMPRPYQPLRGAFVSGPAPSSENNAEGFGSNGGTYTAFTGANGQTTIDHLAGGTWDVYYNWIPEPNGCRSPNGLPPSQTTNGDWNIYSATYGGYEPLSPAGTLNISYTANEDESYYNAPPFSCNMVASDLSGTDSPLVTIMGTSPANLNVAFDTRVPSPLSGNNGPFTLAVYDATGTPVGSQNIIATAASSNGYGLTFPFPAGQSGPLPTGIYGTEVNGTDMFGNQVNLGGEGYFFIGSANPNFVATPFGVAVQDFSEIDTSCTTFPSGYENPDEPDAELQASPEMLPPGGTHCTTSDFQGSSPVVTSLSQGTLTTNSGVVPVGQRPVAVITYGTAPASFTTSNEGDGNYFRSTQRDIDGTGYALVVNNGSNDVSIVDLVNLTLITTVPVGQAPDAAAINSGGNYAYVANYIDGTISVVSLNNNTVVGTFPVGSNPTAVSVDAAGNVWVGGNGYLNEYNSSTYALVSTTPVSGIVNSLALSAAQGMVVSNVIQPASSSSPHAMAMVSTGNMSTPSGQSSVSTMGADAYVSSSMAPSLATPYLLGGATVVSANYQNNLAVSATPTGFIVQDVSTGDILASATTSAPIRSIAVDQNFGFAYMTIPDTNTVITFPLPGSAN